MYWVSSSPVIISQYTAKISECTITAIDQTIVEEKMFNLKLLLQMDQFLSQCSTIFEFVFFPKTANITKCTISYTSSAAFYANGSAVCFAGKISI
jgi:hypothetical protein